MMPNPVVITLLASAALLLAGCGNDKLETPPDVKVGLHQACAVIECICVDDSAGLFTKAKTADLVWKESGDAGCPAGFKLKRVETDFLGRKR